jgi:hypothetical protein
MEPIGPKVIHPLKIPGGNIIIKKVSWKSSHRECDIPVVREKQKKRVLRDR